MKMVIELTNLNHLIKTLDKAFLHKVDLDYVQYA
jgi:hypothetical protein